MPYIYFCDTEYTTWPGALETDWAEDWQHKELVQIAILKVDLASFETVDHFECLVKPVKNPLLSPLFTELTQISQTELDERGLAVADAFTKAKAFIFQDSPKSTQDEPVIIAYGNDNLIFEETARLNNLPAPFKKPFTDCRDLVALTGTDPTAYTSGSLYKAAGLNLQGHIHNALHDCQSMAAALAVWVNQYPELKSALNRLFELEAA